MQIYAHRAGRGIAAENTLEACQLSLQFPIDFIDFDIGMTRDGEVVVTHDLTLNPDITRGPDGRFITEEIPICTLSYAELSRYNVGQINPQAPYAAYFPLQRSFPYARIPLLKEAVAYVSQQKPTVGFQLEIKTDPTQAHLSHSPEMLAEAVYSVVHKSGILERTEVQAFDYRCLLSLQKLDTRIQTAYLTHPCSDEAPDACWHAGHALASFGHSYPRMIHALGGKCWGPFQMDVTRASLAEAQELGLKVVAWGYPEREGTDFNGRQIAQLREWGIDGIITDRPDKMGLRL